MISMQVIVRGDIKIQRLMVPLSVEQKAYKLSQFVIRQRTDDGLALGNTMTGEVVVLNPDEEDLISELPAPYNNKLSEFITKGYVVPQSLDETKRVSQLREIILKHYENKKIYNSYNILPTTICNARCFYCFENGFEQLNMSEDTADKLVEFISSHRGNRKIRLNWFGGEPTLGIRRIDQICGQLQRKGIEYESHMVSNAYLFNEDLVKHAKTNWNLVGVQVTLDGTADIYNKTKAYVYKDSNPFERVLHNIELLLDEKIVVVIRLNLGDHNEDDLDVLIDELVQRFEGRDNLTVYIRQLRENTGFKPVLHNSEDRIRLKKRYLELTNKLEEVGWKQIWHFTLPRLRAWSCMADNPHVLQCAPDGVLGKCEDYIHEHAVGSLEAGVINEREYEWLKQQEYYDECRRCLLLPSCTHLLKNCPSKQLGCPEEEKEKRLQLCHDSILDAYQQWKKNGSMWEVDHGISNTSSGKNC